MTSKIDFNVLTLFLGRACPLECIYCFEKKNAGDGRPELGLDKRLSILDEAKTLAHNNGRELELVIPGAGEPLIDSQFVPIIEKAHSLGMATIAYTCGWHMTEYLVKSCKDNDVQLNLKIESLDPQIHDFLTGRIGSLERALQSAEMVLAAGGKLAIASLYTALNLPDINDVRVFCKNKGIRHFIDVLGSYGDREMPAWLFPSREDIESIAGGLEESLMKEDGCKAWKHGIHIRPDGEAATCGAVRRENIGNVRQMSLKGLWDMKNRIFPYQEGRFTCVHKDNDYLLPERPMMPVHLSPAQYDLAFAKSPGVRETYEIAAGMIDAANPSICELGAGSGSFTRVLLSRGFKVLAIEASREFCNYGPKKNPGAEWLNEDYQDVHLKHDILVTAFMAHHIEDPAQFAKKAYASLNPGGQLVVADCFINYATEEERIENVRSYHSYRAKLCHDAGSIVEERLSNYWAKLDEGRIGEYKIPVNRFASALSDAGFQDIQVNPGGDICRHAGKVIGGYYVVSARR